MRKICNNEWEPRNKNFERALNQSKPNSEYTMISAVTSAYGRITNTSKPYTNSDGSVSVSATEEEQALEKYWNEDNKLAMTTVNELRTTNGLTVKQGDTIQLTQGQMPNSYQVNLQTFWLDQPVSAMRSSTSGITTITDQNGIELLNTAPLTDTELIKNLTDRVKMLETAIIDLSARCRSLNAELGMLVSKKLESDTKWFLNPETGQEEEQLIKPGRKFRPIPLEA